jgi:eukaryotic-like serine/threonine-protein kinase
MDADRWHRIEALFDQAMDLPEAERRRFIAAACGGDGELERELTALIANAPSAATSLRGVVAAEVRRLTSEVASAQIGRRIGAFRLIALLGEGGMGAVYLGERADAQFSQRAAIKILPHALSSPALIARFRDERQILAGLEHPNIVRLLDGGSTDHDLPYLVMEHIEGTTITRYAERCELAIRARVAMVRQVCAALQYAHQNLVVHRDIKPSNILVDADGAPKILDFGIAKLLAPTPGFEREAVTHTGLAMGTPGYLSPEQARGDAVSTATDVYSVGAVLYELVTGRPPHDTSGSALEILRVICDVDPPRPSVVAPAAVRRELAGDLDNIILKTLRKEPGQRYASMDQLSDDLGRWLDGLPVAARTSTIGYRARKFVRRNRAGVAAATLVAAALLAATVVSLRQARRADDQAAQARTERSNAEAARANAETERANAIEAATRAQNEAERARKAEAQVQAQLDEITAVQSARATAEAEARAKGSEAQLSREQLQVALSKAKEEKAIAEQESLKAREAEERAQAAARAEKAIRQEVERKLAEARKQISDGPLR